MLMLQASLALASQDSIGPNGINSLVTGLNGNNINIGQVELYRPGNPGFDTTATLMNSSVDPEQVFFRNPPTYNAVANTLAETSDHVVKVAGILISDHATATGVAPEADLYSVGVNEPALGPTPELAYQQFAESSNLLATMVLPNIECQVVRALGSYADDFLLRKLAEIWCGSGDSRLPFQTLQSGCAIHRCFELHKANQSLSESSLKTP